MKLLRQVEYLHSFSCHRSKESTENKQEPPSLPAGVQGLGLGLPEIRTKKKGKQKVSEESHVTEALDKLREQTREAVKGLESVTSTKPGGEDLGKDVEDWVKQFEELAGSQVICFSFTFFFELLFFFFFFWDFINVKLFF